MKRQLNIRRLLKLEADRKNQFHLQEEKEQLNHKTRLNKQTN